MDPVISDRTLQDDTFQSARLPAQPTTDEQSNAVSRELETRRNWARNIKYQRTGIGFPRDLEEIRTLVLSHENVRALGSRHSFNRLADTKGVQISLSEFNRVLDIDSNLNTVTIEGGVRYSDLCPVLERAGLALPNLASLPHISVAGACSTSTHGSGDSNQSLASAVSEIEIMTANGNLMNFCRTDGEIFNGVVVALGSLGVVTKMTLDVVPAFAVSQHVYENLPFEAVFENFDQITSAAYSVSLFTTWQSDAVEQVWLKQAGSAPFSIQSDFFGASQAIEKLHPIPGVDPKDCTDQFGEPGPAYNLTHFRIDGTPSHGNELQSEYIFPREHAVQAIRKVRELAEELRPVLHISEIRTIAADSHWLSPFYQQDSVGIHFTWKKLPRKVGKVLDLLEEAFADIPVRPHWGKIFKINPEVVRGRYPKFANFEALRSEIDPSKKFTNDFIRKISSISNR